MSEKITCPECGERLVSGSSQPLAHMRTHWGVDPRTLDRLTNKEALKRATFLAEHVDAIPIRKKEAE